MINRTGSAGPISSEDVDTTIEFAECAAQSADNQPFAVPGALVGDSVTVTPLAAWPEGIGYPSGQCLVAGTIQFRIVNPTDAAVDPGSQLVRVHLEHN